MLREFFSLFILIFLIGIAFLQLSVFLRSYFLQVNSRLFHKKLTLPRKHTKLPLLAAFCSLAKQTIISLWTGAILRLHSKCEYDQLSLSKFTIVHNSLHPYPPVKLQFLSQPVESPSFVTITPSRYISETILFFKKYFLLIYHSTLRNTVVNDYKKN